LLVEAAKRFHQCLRPGDTVARLGGDEFAVLLDGLNDPADAHEVATRIERELEQPFQLEGREVYVTVSIGIAPSTNADSNAEELLRQADTAMYRAKGKGRARHEVFDASMHQRAVKMLELETDLWRALERDELRLHYQPIICLQRGVICGFEALVRWQHPERGWCRRAISFLWPKKLASSCRLAGGFCAKRVVKRKIGIEMGAYSCRSTCRASSSRKST
jgi:predicted signal transduction protein with EAL and GGDEF domain